MSARMCASVHSATESSTYDTPAAPPGTTRARATRARPNRRRPASFAVFNNDSADLGSTSVEARTRASRSSADASASIGIASEPVTGGPPCSSTTSTSTSISAPSLGAVSRFARVRLDAVVRLALVRRGARSERAADDAREPRRPLLAGARRRAPACDGEARAGRSRRVSRATRETRGCRRRHRAMFDQRGASPTTPCVPRPIHPRRARARRSARARRTPREPHDARPISSPDRSVQRRAGSSGEFQSAFRKGGIFGARVMRSEATVRGPSGTTTATPAAPRAASARPPPRAPPARALARGATGPRGAVCAPPPAARSRRSARAGAGEELARYDAQAKEDDARQYGVWGVDGIRQRSASFAAMQEDWEDAVLRVWLRHGAGEVAAQRLLIRRAKWQKGAQAELYRGGGGGARGARLDGVLLPGADALFDLPQETLRRAPVHGQTRALETARGASRGRASRPPLDVAATLNKDPSVVSLEDAERIETGVFARRRRGDRGDRVRARPARRRERDRDVSRDLNRTPGGRRRRVFRVQTRPTNETGRRQGVVVRAPPGVFRGGNE